MTGPLSGWIALALVPLTAIAAWVLRRFVRGNFVRRMRPHFVMGYATLAFALVHMWTSMGSMRGANPTGIWLATLALFALGFQTLVGAPCIVHFLHTRGMRAAPGASIVHHVIVYLLIGIDHRSDDFLFVEPLLYEIVVPHMTENL